MDTDLSGLCLKDLAFYADDVADIQLFELLVGFLADGIPGDVDLDRSLQILHMAE